MTKTNLDRLLEDHVGNDTHVNTKGVVSAANVFWTNCNQSAGFDFHNMEQDVTLDGMTQVVLAVQYLSKIKYLDLLHYCNR